MEVTSDFNKMQPHWVEAEDDTCASSISNVSDPDKERRRRERRASKGCNRNNTDGGVPNYGSGDGDAKEPSKVLGEIIREIKQGSSLPPPKEIDLMPPLEVVGTTNVALPIVPRDNPGSRQGSCHRRASVETPRIRSRRASLGGTTFYPTSHMAKIDTFLRGSQLRLNKDGTCSFLFQEKKFVIETTAETCEFLFYCSLGTLAQWKKVWSKKLLRVMAVWNEKQISKEGNGYASKNSEEEEDSAEDDVGLLRIDSSKESGPFVAFILFGHVDKIKDAIHFQDKLDEFVDDALNFYDKLKAGPEVDKDKEEMPKRCQRPLSCNTSSKTSASTNTTCLTSSLTSSEPEGINVASSTHLSNYESSQEEATPAPSTSNASSNCNDDHPSCKKSGVFSKIINGLRLKSKEDIGRLAFVDPNQNSAFVIDTRAADNLKITISRQCNRMETVTIDDSNPRGAGTASPGRERLPGRRHSSQPRSSRRGSAYTDEIHSQSNSRKGSPIDDEHRVHPKKSSSLYVDDRRPSQKSSSFFHDDYNGGIHYPIKKGASWRASSNHNKSRHSHSDRRISTPDSLGASIDNLNQSDKDRCRSTRFNQSEPALAQNRDEAVGLLDKERRRQQTNEHDRSRRSSSRPRRKAHRHDPPNQGVGRTSVQHEQNSGGEIRGRKESRKSLAPPNSPSRPPDIGRSRSRSALRSSSNVGRSRSRSALRKGIDP